MPGLDLSQVSSNWKKLQEKLHVDKSQESSNHGLKRKRADGASKRASGFKRARHSDIITSRRHEGEQMGLSASKHDAVRGPDLAHSTLPKELDIPRRDVQAAYGATTPVIRDYIDDVNGGQHATHSLGKYVGMDCEMVGTGPPPHEDNVLARVSLVNFHGEQIYDSYVLPPPGVIVEDYRTFVSGIKESHLVEGYARPLKKVQGDVAGLLDGRILVGHALWNDLQALLLSHPKRDLRDTSRHKNFRIESKGRPPALRHLARSELGIQIQAGEHSSIEDARAAMMLFKKEKNGFEEENRKRFGTRVNIPAKGAKRMTVNGAGSAASGDSNDSEADDEHDLALLEGEEYNGEIAEDGPVDQLIQATFKKKRKKKKRTKRK